MILLLKNVLRLAGLQGVLALSGLIRNKLLAIHLDVNGFGQFAFFTLVMSTVITLVQFGLNLSLSRAISRESDKGQRQLLVSNANTLVLTIYLICSILFFVIYTYNFNEHDSDMSDYRNMIGVIFILFASVLPEALRNNAVATLQGLQDIKGLSGKRIWATIIATGFAVPLISIYGMTGAAMQIFLLSFITLILLIGRITQQHGLKFSFKLDLKVAKYLCLYGAASVIAGFGHSAIDVKLRDIFIDAWGNETNGFFQSANLIIFQIRSVILGALAGYGIAVFSSEKDRLILSIKMNQMIIISSMLITITMTSVIFLDKIIVSFLYSGDFIAAVKFIPLLVLAEFFQTLYWVYGAVILSKLPIKFWLSLEILHALLKLSIGILIISVDEIYLPLTILLSSIVHFLLNFHFVNSLIFIRTNVKTIVWLIACFSLIISAILSKNSDIYYISAILILFGMLLVVRSEIASLFGRDKRRKKT